MPTARIMIGVATTGRCHSGFNLCKDAVIAHFPSERLAPEVEEQYLTSFYARSSGLCHNFHQIVLEAQRWKATHLLTLEEDMLFRHDVLHILYRKHQMWVGCNYPMKTMSPWTFTALAIDGKNRVLTHEGSNGLEECWYTGFGVTLFDMRIFDAVPKPWFLMDYEGDDQYSTQDAYFAKKVHAAGIPIYTDHDASKLVGHEGDYVFSWQEASRNIIQQAKAQEAAAVTAEAQSNGQ